MHAGSLREDEQHPRGAIRCRLPAAAFQRSSTRICRRSAGTHLSFLIPVPVTGIQPRRVCAVNDFYQAKESPAPKEMGALDPCDGHRDEGIRVASSQNSLSTTGMALLLPLSLGAASSNTPHAEARSPEGETSKHAPQRCC
ncbi:hypothetical protein CO660_19065 [Rhizobium sp. L9]|nr:hypothetical protein CO660_19065 [Rhizobium sp. L9]